MLGYSSTKPLLIFGTRHGSIYNITPTNLKVKIQAISLSMGDFYDHQQTIKNLPQNLSLKKFLGFPENIITYLTPYDFYKKDCMTGCQDGKIIKVKCSKGYTAFDANLYDQMVNLIKPDIYVAMTEYPAIQKDHQKDSNKSLKRAILKTKNYLQNSKLAQQSQNRPKLVGAVHGACNLGLVARSLEDNLKSNIDGMIICDLCVNQTLQQRQVAYNFIIQRLKKQQKQYCLGIAGMGKIEDIKHALKFGFSIFQVNYPFSLAENHQAIIYNSEQDKYQTRTPIKTQQLKPLTQGCNCYTCKTHSQSYIAHLIECFQMNAKVLLTVHNLQVYSLFMRSFEE